MIAKIVQLVTISLPILHIFKQNNWQILVRNIEM